MPPEYSIERLTCAYPDADGRMRSTDRYPTKNRALKAARDARAAVEASPTATTVADTTDKSEKADMTLGEWFNEIWPGWDIELTTRANYSAPIRRFILPTFGARPLKSITRGEVDRWERDLIEKRGYSPEYIGGARRLAAHDPGRRTGRRSHHGQSGYPAARPRTQSQPGPRPGQRREDLGQ